MTTRHDTYPSQNAWQVGEFDPTERAETVLALGNVPDLAAAFTDLQRDLADGSSRTVYRFPVDYLPSGELRAIVSSTKVISEFLHFEGMDAIDPTRYPLLLSENEPTGGFDREALPRAFSTALDGVSPIVGYVRAESVGGNVVHSVGALNLETQTQFDIPMFQP